MAFVGRTGTLLDRQIQILGDRSNATVPDINLGAGLAFKLAETLKDSDLPFILSTGDEGAVIPAGVDAAARLQTPLEFRQTVAAVLKLPPTAV
ncbi:hypothetical protein C0214_00875 [Methylobacterium sp. DM1]|nr:hypothetical protein C0214_00875 [Methylobacterium sp. DM1]